MGRPRSRIVQPRGGKPFVQVYNDKGDEAAKKVVAEVAALSMRGESAFEVPVTVIAEFYIKIPSSMTKAKTELAKRGLVIPETRPDIDNYQKLIMDGMNEIVFKDDNLVSDCHCFKRYSGDPRTVITIKPTLIIEGHIDRLKSYVLGLQDDEIPQQDMFAG